MTYLNNKIALVTGANRGIGKEIVKSFIAAGAAKVYLAVRDINSIKPLVEEFGEKVSPVQVDVSDSESVKAMARQTTDVQVVVNNAGILELAGPLDQHAEQALRKELEVNTFGLLRMSAAYAPIIENNGGGAFVQLNSVASIKNFNELTTYSASKAASYSITQGLRESLKDRGVSVLSVHPGPIATDMATQAGFTEGTQDPSSVSEGIVESLQAGNFLLFPDAVAKEFESAYDSYAKSFIDAE